MTYRISYETNTKEFESKFGGFNDCPPNLKEITREEFERVTIHGSYSPKMMDYRQVRPGLDGKSGYTNMHLWIFGDETGVASTSVYGDGKYVAKFYKFAVCQHEYTTMPEEAANEFRATKGLSPIRYTRGNCCHNEICKHCGRYVFIDTSD